MEATLTKISDGYACRVKGVMPVKEGKALIEVDIKPTTQDRIIIRIPKSTKIYLG
jgi:hypothetical protein